MEYRLMSGILYNSGNKPLASIHSQLCTQEKQISTTDGQHICCTNVISRPDDYSGNVHLKKYICTDEKGATVITAKPEYNEHEDPEKYGWPVNRMPAVDHASLQMSGVTYNLIMENSTKYTLSTLSGKNIISFQHRGLSGGWNINSSFRFSPEILCSIFTFCRYIEQENEFLIV